MLSYISAERTTNQCFVSKWRPKKGNFEFSFPKNSHVTKIWKSTKGILKQYLVRSWKTWIHWQFRNEIWKKVFCFKMRVKTSFVIITMLVQAAWKKSLRVLKEVAKKCSTPLYTEMCNRSAPKFRVFFNFSTSKPSARNLHKAQ